MPDQFVMYLLSVTVGALASVLWWLGRKTITRLDQMEISVNKSIGDLKVSVALDMGGIRERLARLEGHAGIGK